MFDILYFGLANVNSSGLALSQLSSSCLISSSSILFPRYRRQPYRNLHHSRCPPVRHGNNIAMYGTYNLGTAVWVTSMYARPVWMMLTGYAVPTPSTRFRGPL